MRRQGATSKGLKRRLEDLRLDKVEDQRISGKVKYSMKQLLTGLVAGQVTAARSLRDVEMRTFEIARKRQLGLRRRIADNTFSKILPKVNHSDLVACLHRMVKKEHRRGNLDPTLLPMGTIAIDGKHLGTLKWPELCRRLDLEEEKTNVQEVKSLLASKYPQLQLCIPEKGQPYALVRVHTVTLISSAAAVCIHQRPIQGHTNG